jgi:hypothetical protein
MYLALDNGLPGFQRGFSSLVVLRESAGDLNSFADRAFTFYGRPSQAVWLESDLVTPCNYCHSYSGPYNTIRKTPAGLQSNGLGYSLFARHY